ncbi:PREDICTED: exonuclease 3'-5' domain-containing protein 2-like [Acropora digitifera]|uniref:exonuclease 3'-5' domain-containing protein 2-like n=1 Tax=Acropora digitifera TaxID=70779 RepID=UPI00077A46E3|nr:PREDICTED: exonuclease 3'-5' domain-containing protein 2-like [Acropora digitifera]
MFLREPNGVIFLEEKRNLNSVVANRLFGLSREPIGGLPPEKKRSKYPKTARVFVLEDSSSCDKLVQFTISKYHFKLNYIGIDCEWVNNEGQQNMPVALLQIATPLCDCFLVRLCKMDGQMPQIVKEILEDKAVLKFGVGIQNDAKRLFEMFAIHVRGCVDLRYVAQRTQLENRDQSHQKVSLDALAKRILGVALNKSKEIRCSNWEEEKLSAEQIEYAMNDALVAIHIFLTLVKEEAKQSLDSEDFSPCKEMCDFRDVWNGDEGTNQSSAITSECHPDSNETCLTLEESGENAELYLTGQEVAAGFNEHHDSPISEVAENRNLSQEGNWEAEKPSIQEIEYAMNDDLPAILIFLREIEVIFRDVCNEDLADGFGHYYKTTINLSKFESEEMDGYLSTDEVINLISHPKFAQWAGSLCQGLIDIPSKARKRKGGSSDKHSISYPQKLQMPSKNASTRKSPLYKNCILTAPDGSRLCCLDRKKADWYIDKELGHLTNADPYTVQLNVEPAGRPCPEDNYYLNRKVNECVVCGSDDSYMKKSVVPHEYRRHFPAVMKNHTSHDILLTCQRCHRLASSNDNQLREELAKKYNAPLGNGTVSHLKEDPELKKVKSAAKALSRAGNKIPEDRRQELSLIVQKHFSASALTPEMISQAATMETHKENANFVSHGFEVVDRVRTEGNLLEFEKMWRKHFVDTMQPKFLPPLWSVDHRHEILKGELRDRLDH